MDLLLSSESWIRISHSPTCSTHSKLSPVLIPQTLLDDG